jgi:hypothetical protein
VAATYATAVGSNTDATGHNSTAVGYGAASLGEAAIALGYLAGADADNTIHINASGVNTNQPQTAGYIVIETDDASLTYDGTWSLAGGALSTDGLDVTGTVTVDGLTVQTSQGDITIPTNTSSLNFARAGANYIRATDTSGSFHFVTGANDFATTRLRIDANGDVQFFEDTGATPKFFWDASTERLGLGTTSPSAKLDVLVGSDERLLFTTLGSDPFISAVNGANSAYKSLQLNGSDLKLLANGTERMRVNSTGIDVTGTATMDGLVVDGNVTVGTQNVGSDKTLQFYGAGGSEQRINFADGVATDTFSVHYDGTDASPSNDLYIESVGNKLMKFDQNGDISFYEDTGTSAKFHWDAASESLGIGTDNPRQDLEIFNGETGSGIRLAATATAYWDIERDPTSGHLTFTDDGAGTVLTVGQNGLVGIGADNPNQLLSINSDIAGARGISFDQSGVERVKLLYTNSSGAFTINNTTAGYTSFENNGTEACRIDSSQNLLVGCTNTSISTVGHALLGGGADNGIARHIANGIEALQVGRNTSDGDLAKFYKDGTTIGSIGTNSSRLTIGSGDTGLLIAGDLDNITPFNTSTNASRDAAVDLGNSGVRFKDLYLSGEVNITDASSPTIRLVDSTNSNTLLMYAQDATSHIGTYSNHPLVFDTNSTEAMRIDTSGNLLVGTTDSSVYNNNTNTSADNGINLMADGKLYATKSGASVAIFNRTSSDGNIVEFNKSGTTVGSVGTRASYLTVGSGDTGFLFNSGEDIIQPESTTGGARDGAISLGASGARFKDLYLSGGAYLGGTAAANKLDDYEEGTFTPVMVGSTTAGTGTYTAQSGHYTKIGNTVTAHVLLQWSAHTGTGNIQLTGFPVNPAGTHYIVPFTSALTLSSGYTAEAFIQSNNLFNLYQVNATGSSIPVPMDTSAQVAFTVTYRTS